MERPVRGRVRLGRRTKQLVPALRPGEIAVIHHKDLDRLAAEALVRAGVRAVLNAAPTISGRYPNGGPMVLLRAGVPVVDCLGEAPFQVLADGDEVEVRGGDLYRGGSLVATGRRLTEERARRELERAAANVRHEIEQFVENTLRFAAREKEFFLGPVQVPPIATRLEGAQVLVVVRGQGYREDLEALRSYIEEVRPVLIGVDGGADALLEAGFQPHLIVGDMDSVSDRALGSPAELVVHAYPDGRAPGLERVQRLGRPAWLFAAPGTSEDVALLLAIESGAALLVAVGSHSNLIDFLEKGRAGMASTFLVRLKAGPRLIDARGVATLYRGRPPHHRHLAELTAAALLPLLLLLALAEPLRVLLRLALLRIQLLLGP